MIRLSNAQRRIEYLERRLGSSQKRIQELEKKLEECLRKVPTEDSQEEEASHVMGEMETIKPMNRKKKVLD